MHIAKYRTTIICHIYSTVTYSASIIGVTLKCAVRVVRSRSSKIVPFESFGMFLQRDAMLKRGLCRHAVSVCVSVCVSVRQVHGSCENE